MEAMTPPPIVPELDVTDIGASTKYYVDVLGFRVRFERPEEEFVYLERQGAALMLQAAEGDGRRFRTAPLERPYGRGVNLQINASDAATVFLAARMYDPSSIVLDLEVKWYRTDEGEVGNRQFVVADPDGYLLRFFEDLGPRPADA